MSVTQTGERAWAVRPEGLLPKASGPEASGSRTVNVLPCFSSLRTVMVPWWASTMAREIVRPRPLPGMTRCVAASVR